MLRFCTENAQATAMGVLLGTAALVALVLATRGGGFSEIDLKYSESEDISSKADVFTTHRLPLDARFMPSIGNGHLSTNIFSDTVYMNGLYSGRRGESHRGRIPAWCNVRLNSTLANQPYAPVYTLDTSTGAFEAFVDREMSVVRHRVYAHKYYTRAIINQILISAKPHLDPNFNHQVRRVHLTFNPGPESSDITFKRPKEVFIINRRIWTTCGLTKESEDLEYQKTASKVCAFWTAVPDHLIVPRHDTKVHTFVMTADKNETVARLEMEKVLQESEYKLFHKHKMEWSNLLNKSRFHIEGNLKLAKIVSGIWYYLLSSLPSEKTYQKQDLYYGLSPGSLARGGLLEDYEGHNFWDTEIWMFPSILMLHPKLAQKLLQYRIEMATVAANLAKDTGHKGIRFPWESAFTGQEVTQPCCPDVAEFEHHITGSIAFATRQYLAVTRDEKWLKNGGCSIVTKMAEFWSSRVTYNDSTGFYDIKNVMGPDEDHSNVSNSVFTNVVAGYSLYLAQYVACLCRSFYLTDNPDEWADIAWNLALPYDKDEDYHPQFTGYKRSYKIKQADAVLLGFPLQYPMKESTRANDLTFYETMTRASGPAMTWSMHTIGHLALGNNLRAAYLFNRSFVEFVREPFKVWSELKRPNVGCVNFLTGMGGFLQSLLFGYAGVSIHLDRLEIRKPQLPPEATRFQIKGLNYLGSTMILDITLKSTILQVISTDKEWPLVINIENERTELEKGLKVILEGNGPFIIKTIRKDHNCPLPQDLIGQTGARPANRRKDYTGF